MLLFSSFDFIPSPNKNFVTAFGKTILPCTNNVIPSYETWQKLINTPFGPLEESYVRCHNDLFTSFQNALNTGLTNTFTFYSILLVVVSYIISVFVSKYNVPVTYSETEKKEALDALLTSLLQARDQRLKTKDGQDGSKVLEKLVKDLEFTATLSKFYISSEAERLRQDADISIEMSKFVGVSDVNKNPMSEIAEAVVLNDYHLDALLAFNSIEPLQKYLSGLLDNMGAVMNIRFKINGSSTVTLSKESYDSLRGVLLNTANLKSIDIDILNQLFILDPSKKPDEVQAIMRDEKVFYLVDNIARVLYIHGKLVSGASYDPMTVSQNWFREEAFSKGIAYSIGQHVIDLHTLHEYRRFAPSFGSEP